MVNDLIFKTPEELGLSSNFVLEFIKRIREWKINLHSFMLVKDGAIMAEGYYKPFDKDFEHRLYSTSKTFVAMAVGLLCDEGKIRLTDCIADYFPEYRDTQQHKWLQECTIEDALKMSVPQPIDTYYERQTDRWAWTFFNVGKAVKPAGTIFQYNTSGTFILDVLVEKLTGKTFLQYLQPVLDEIGVSRDIWCVEAPDGYSWGGSGVVATLRDFAKFGEFILNKGLVNGKQLISREYMEKATSKQICNLYENNYSIRTTTGYGSQIWITDEGYSLYGMGSQYVFCFPKKNFMFVCQGDTQCSADSAGDIIYDAVKRLLYENIQDKALPSNEAASKELSERLASLELNAEFGDKHSDFEKVINGQVYRLEANPMSWKWFKFDFDGDNGVLTYENPRGVKQIKFSFGSYTVGTFPETHYYDKRVDTPAGRELDCMMSAGWTEHKKLLLRVYITDINIGNCFMNFAFKGEQGEEVGLLFMKRAEFFMDGYQGFAGGYKDV